MVKKNNQPAIFKLYLLKHFCFKYKIKQTLLFHIYHINANKKLTNLRFFCFNYEQTAVKQKTHIKDSTKNSFVKTSFAFCYTIKDDKTVQTKQKAHSKKQIECTFVATLNSNKSYFIHIFSTFPLLYLIRLSPLIGAEI